MACMIDSWAVNPLELGPLYPFAGLESVMFALGVAAWLAWTFWQAWHENHAYTREARALKRYEDLVKALKSQEGRPERTETP